MYHHGIGGTKHKTQRGIIFGLTVLVAWALAACGPTTRAADVQALVEAADKERAAHRPEACIAAYSKVLAAQPESVNAYVGRAACYLEKNNAAAAVQDYKEAIRLSPSDPGLFLLRASAFQSIGNNSAAAADYKKVAELASANPDHILQSAQGLGRMGFYPEALAVLTQGLRAFPNSWRLHHYRASLEIAVGDDQEAAKEFETALRLATGTGLAAVLADRASFYVQRQKYALAIADLDQAVRLHPDYSYYAARGRARLAAGDFARATADFSAAINAFKILSSADNGPLVRLFEERGNLFLQQGQKEKALADFRQALELLPQSAIAERARVTGEITSAGG